MTEKNTQKRPPELKIQLDIPHFPNDNSKLERHLIESK